MQCWEKKKIKVSAHVVLSVQSWYCIFCACNGNESDIIAANLSDFSEFVQILTHCPLLKKKFHWYFPLFETLSLQKKGRKSHKWSSSQSKFSKCCDNPIGPLGFLHGKLGLRSPGKASNDGCITQPVVNAWCSSVSISHRNLTWTTGSLICEQMLMHVIAHRCTVTVRVCTESWLGEKSLTAPGNQTCISGMLVWLPTELCPPPRNTTPPPPPKCLFTDKSWYRDWYMLCKVGDATFNIPYCWGWNTKCANHSIHSMWGCCFFSQDAR